MQGRSRAATSRPGGWSPGEGAWRETPQPCIKLISPYSVQQLGLESFLLFQERATGDGCTTRLRPRHGQGPVLVLVAPRGVLCRSCTSTFWTSVRAAGLDAEALRTRHAVLQCDPAPLDDFLAGRWSEALAQTHDEDLAPL